MSRPFEKVDKARDLARSGDYNGALKLINEWLLAYEQILNNASDDEKIALPPHPDPRWYELAEECYKKATDPKKTMYAKTFDEISTLHTKLATRPK